MLWVTTEKNQNPNHLKSNTRDLKRLSKLDLEALLVSHLPTHAQRDKRHKKKKKHKHPNSKEIFIPVLSDM